MTDEERIEKLEYISFAKGIYQFHLTNKIIQDDKEREAYLFEIACTIADLEKEIADSLNKN
jgi:hypothetical protein